MSPGLEVRCQLGVGCLWALLLWGYPDTRKLPELTFERGARILEI